MNAAGYHHDLPGEQGDPLDASLAYGMGIYANWFLQIYCMFTVRESDLVGNAIVIERRIIDEFRRADGRIGIVRYDRIKRYLIGRSILETIFPRTVPSFTGPASSVTTKAFQGTLHILVIKTPKYAYQREYRIIGRNRPNGTLSPTRTTLAAETKGTVMRGWT